MDAKNEEELKEIKRKIMLARSWAYNHFNAANCNDSRIVDDTMRFLPPSFFVEFPSPDEMIVTPSFMAQKLSPSFRYKLHFRKDGTVYWQGKHPFYGSDLPPLEVSIDPERMRNVIIEEQVLHRQKILDVADDQEAINAMYQQHGQHHPSEG